MIEISREIFDDAVKGVLEKPEYLYLKYLNNSIISNLKNSLKSRIEQFLESIIKGGKSIHVSDTTAGILLVLLIGALIFLFTFIYVKLLKASGGSKRIAKLFGTIIDEESSPRGMMEKSREYEKAGDFRNAVKFSFIALLLIMNNNNILILDESKTNRELLRDLKKENAKLSGVFQSLICRFDDVWYGHRTITEDSYGCWKADAQNLWEGVLHEAENK